MRDYGSVSPQFWIGKTGKALRGKPDAQLLALYLMTCPHANMIGVFHCPVMYMAHETGMGLEGASKALQSLIDLGFCMYDEDSETVFVIRMAAHQVGENLKADDNKVKGVQKEVGRIAVDSLRLAFIDHYAEAFHLKREAPSKPLRSPEKAPSKQLTGTGQEQEQEQEQDIAPPRASRKPVDVVVIRVPDLVAEGVNEQHAKDWIKARKVPLTVTAWNGVKAEAAKAGITPADAVRISAEKGWRGFEAAWIKPQGRASPQTPQDTTAEAMRLLGFLDGDVIDA